MKQFIQAGLATAFVVAALSATPASAADLGEWGGSMKDTPMEYAPSRNCYVGAALGYSWANDPDIGYANTLGITFQNRTFDDAWLADFYAGCSLGHGFRAELAYTTRKHQDLIVYPTPSVPNDPIFTSLHSDTYMANLYYDFASWGRITPYVGAGIGFAHHEVENVIFQNAGALGNNPQFGKDSTEFAWQLMAGVRSQISEHIKLDIGYRYVDMGDASSQGLDNVGFINPELEVNDLNAHEFRIGVSYDVGSLF